MPLFVENNHVTIDQIFNLGNYHDKTEKLCKLLKSEEICSIESNYCLYINQKEFAAISPNQKIKYIGSDDATTCHIVVFRHTGSGCISLGHLDGTDTKEFLDEMIFSLKKLSFGAPEGRYEVHVVGGFNDDKLYSRTLTQDIFTYLINLKENIYLQTACVLDENNIIKDDLNFPIIYGIAVEMQTGRVFAATFKNKGPDLSIRSAGHYDENKRIVNVFQNDCLIIGPFHWKTDIEPFYAQLPDHVILKHFSTSPQQEPDHFCDHMRQVFQILSNHPRPLESLFPSSQPIIYKLDEHGEWTKI